MSETRGMNLEQDNQIPIPKSKNFLLAIGIDSYKYCPALKNAVRDAKDIANVLCEEYSFESENTVLITNEQATENNILSHFEELVTKVGPNDNAIIFFSGHGIYNDYLKMGAWVPVDAHPENRGDFIDNSVILNLVKVINSKHTFLIADSCFSGTLFEGTRDVGAERSLKHLKKMVTKNSRWGLTSGGNELVSDGQGGNNSPFTENLLRFLKSNTEKPFSVSKLVFSVSKDTEKITHQTPDSGRIPFSGDERGEMVFIPRKMKALFHNEEEIIERQAAFISTRNKNTSGQPKKRRFFY